MPPQAIGRGRPNGLDRVAAVSPFVNGRSQLLAGPALVTSRVRADSFTDFIILCRQLFVRWKRVARGSKTENNVEINDLI
jgi:hypothetical protein